MSDMPELVSVMTDEEADTLLRQDIIALLSRNPHCPLAQLLGQALADLAR